MATRIWKFLATDIHGLVAGDGSSSGLIAADAVLRLAATLKTYGPQAQEVGPLVGQVTSLLDLLNLPISKFLALDLSFEAIAESLLLFYRDKTHQEPSLAQCVVLLSQAAYLESLTTVLGSPRLAEWRRLRGQEAASDAMTRQLQSLTSLEIDDGDIRIAIIDFPRSQLAQELNDLLSQRLNQLGIKATAAHHIAQRTAQLTDQRLRSPLLNLGERVQRLVEWYRIGGRAALQKYLAIDLYLEAVIQPLATAPSTLEAISLRDIYIPPKAHLLTPLTTQPALLPPAPSIPEVLLEVAPKAPSQSPSPFPAPHVPLPTSEFRLPSSEFRIPSSNCPPSPNLPLHSWVLSWLEDPKAHQQILAILGAPGRGKTMFCRMLADWSRLHLHPLWTPLYIDCALAPAPHADLEIWLGEAIAAQAAQTILDPSSPSEAETPQTNEIPRSVTTPITPQTSPSPAQRFTLEDPNWLASSNVRFLILLDNLDALCGHCNSATNRLNDFLTHLAHFHQHSTTYLEREHRILVTLRPPRPIPQGPNNNPLPPQYCCLELQPFDTIQQTTWLQQWAKRHGTTADPMWTLLQDPRLPASVRALACEPLFLGLLAEMYHQGRLRPEPFDGASAAEARVQLYTRLIDALLHNRLKSSARSTQTQLVSSHTSLRPMLQEAALCAVQSARGEIPFAWVAQRLQPSLNQGQPLVLNREQWERVAAVASLRPARAYQPEDMIIFSHPSFSNFLFAERLQTTFERWFQPQGRPIPELDWQLYDLLGYGGFSREMVEALMVLMERSRSFSAETMFRCLHHFYLRWAEGEMIDGTPPNLPQRKLQQLERMGGADAWDLGQREVDVFTGLNVMILLLELNRYARSHEELKQTLVFYPNGRLEHRCPNRLQRIIHYSHGIRPHSFSQVVGPFLGQVYLSGSQLAGVDLHGTNLRGADLSGNDLRGANLRGADLSGADLSGADLSGADLAGATLCRTALSRASLCGAQLQGVRLSNADLIGAQLQGADLSEADLSLVDLSLADLHSANLMAADLNLADLRNAQMAGAQLAGAQLTRASLNGADLRGAVLRGANLSLAELGGVDLSLVDLSGANLSLADLSGADLSGADLSGADLSGADLSGARLRDVHWAGSTCWEGVRGLERAHQVPEGLMRPRWDSPEAKGSDLVDSGSADSGSADSGLVDSDLVDSGSAASGLVDSGSADSGSADSGLVDSGSAASGSAASGLVDSGSAASGSAASGLANAGLTDAEVAHSTSDLDRSLGPVL